MARIDLTGQKFGKLTVMAYAHGGNNSHWWCMCDCGDFGKKCTALNLKSGNTTSCGCKHHQPSKRFVDLVGQVFGRLTVLENVSRAKGINETRTNWLCKCSCPLESIITVEGHNLKSGHTQSCGCYQIEQTSVHGCCTVNKRLYNIWLNMIDRCHDPSSTSYKYYGAKGRKVCDDWHDVRKFFDWALANGYADDLTIERKKVNGNYEPDNCEWMPLKWQNQNTTKSLGKEKVIAIRKMLDEGKTPKEIAKHFNAAYTTIISIKNFENYKDFRPD